MITHTHTHTHTHEQMTKLMRWLINIIKGCGVGGTNVCRRILWSPCHLADRRCPGGLRVSECVCVCVCVCEPERERKRIMEMTLKEGDKKKEAPPSTEW